VLWPVVAVVRWRYNRPFAYSGHRALDYRLLRACAGLGVAAVVLWFVVLQIVSAASAFRVDGLLHLAQAISFIGFAGGTAVAVWNLTLAFKEGSWLSKLYALLMLAAFGFMLWIGLHYHLIGVSGQF